MIAKMQNQSMGVRLCFAFAYCSAFYALLFLFEGKARDVVTLGLVTVFPFFYGTAVQLVLDPHRARTLWNLLNWGAVPVVALCAVLLILQFETLICVAILLPIFIVLMALGLLVMRWLLGRNVVASDSNKLNVSVWLLPVFALPMMGQISFPTSQKTVTTQIEIAAPRDVVWANTFEIAPIQDHEHVWTVSHNLLNTPLPIDATVTGLVRQLRWSHGIRFQEHLTEVVADEKLAWDFVFHAPETLRSFDPHVAPQGSIVYLQGGAYTLSPLPSGKTQLTLHTNYSLTGPLNGYLSLWGDVFLQDFHHAVLSVVKSRSENTHRIEE